MIAELLASTPWQQSSEKLEGFLIFLQEHNKNINLVSRKLTSRDIFVDHILDSLLADPFLKPGQFIADIGSGAGFPGLCLALVREDLKFCLVEKSFRKCEFLQACVEHFNLQDRVRVYNKELQLQELPSEVDTIISRAMCSAKKLFSLLQPQHKNRSFEILLYKARLDKIHEEIAELPPHLDSKIHELRLFHSDKTRHLLMTQY